MKDVENRQLIVVLNYLYDFMINYLWKHDKHFPNRWTILKTEVDLLITNKININRVEYK